MPTFTWNGGTAVFSDPANWTPAGVPRANDTGAIASGVAAIAGFTLDSVSLQLGGAGTTGTLAANAPAGTSFAGALTDGVIDAAGAGGGGMLEIAGEFDLRNESTLAASNGADLTVTLAPASNGALGVLLAAQGLGAASIAASGPGSTLRIVPFAPADAYSVAFVNDVVVKSAGGTIVDEVPTYAQANQGGLFEAAGGRLEFGSSVAGQLILLGPPLNGASAPTLILDQPDTFQSFIGSDTGEPGFNTSLGLPVGAAIDLRGLAATSLSFSPNQPPEPPGNETLTLRNGGTAVGTLRLLPATGAFGVSLASDGAGGTVLRVDVSSAGPRPGAGSIDPTIVQVPGSHDQFSVLPGAGGETLAGPSYNDLVTPDATLRFTDGRLFFDPNSQGGALLRFYAAALDRAPDAGGLSFWNTRLDQGASLQAVAAAILSTPEYVADAAGQGAAGFVTRLYSGALGRSPDPGGAAYWNGLLAGGTSQANVLTSFVSAPEAVQHGASSLAGGLFIPFLGTG